MFYMKAPFLKKYQPKFLNEFFMDPAYIELIDSLIKMDNLNILLIGNTGCGKTSLLDAIVREYYKTPKIDPFNVLYINNLQEQGISYYRNEVKTFCQTTSSVPSKKKIVILDDIDFINDQSQQVFRNCIDKYSHNVHFIASCSNTQKVIESIQSRCTLIKINPVGTDILKKLILKIKIAEAIDIAPDAEDFILNICNNSIRLVINYMEKFKLLNCPITLEKTKDICTNISYFDFEKYTEYWYKKRDFKNARKIIFSLYNKGYSVMDILDSYFHFVKFTDILSETDKYKIIKFIMKYIAYFHTLHENPIELTFFTFDLLEYLDATA